MSNKNESPFLYGVSGAGRARSDLISNSRALKDKLGDNFDIRSIKNDMAEFTREFERDKNNIWVKEMESAWKKAECSHSEDDINKAMVMAQECGFIEGMTYMLNILEDILHEKELIKIINTEEK